MGVTAFVVYNGVEEGIERVSRYMMPVLLVLVVVEVKLPNGSVGQLLDVMDYISNSVMMLLIALLSTVLIGRIKTPDYVIGEMERNGETFRRKKLYTVMMRYVASVMMLVLFMQSTGILA